MTRFGKFRALAVAALLLMAAGCVIPPAGGAYWKLTDERVDQPPEGSEYDEAANGYVKEGRLYVKDEEDGNYRVYDRVRAGRRVACFTPETLIRMADGSEKPITQVTVGERVLGKDGRINRVLAIKTPKDDGNLIYGFNGESPFVTANHPFFTAEGWKAIDPRLTLEEDPDFEEQLGSLDIGDVVRVRRSEASGFVLASTGGSAVPEVGHRRIETMRATVDRDGKPLYALVLDGNHSYFANGYLVHNGGK